MHGPSTSELETDSPHLMWSDHNERGLASAAEGAWDEATASFAGAADALAVENDVASHEALALVLNNLAQSCFRVGKVDDAIRHAQRACALRVALVGEDAIAVARARSDLAVLLSSTGRADESMALITRAISGIERSAGDEALQLSYVLENAARLAMASGQPSTAEPYLLRLHALLAVHDLPTDRADALLAGVAHHRTHARLAFGLPTPELRSEEVRSEEVRSDEVQDAPVEAEEARIEAVNAEESVLDVVETTESPEPDRNGTADVEAIELTLEDVLFDVTPAPSTIIGLDLELVELDASTDAEITSPAPSAPAPATGRDVLGFEVRYGTQTDDEVAELASTTIARPASTRIPTPPATPAVTPAIDTREAPRAPNASDDAARERRFRRPIIRI